MADKQTKPQTPEEIARAMQQAALEQMQAMMGNIPGLGASGMGDMQAQIMAQMQAAVPDLAEIQAQQAAMGTLGGVDAATAPLCVEAGADVLVAGSAVFGAADPAAAVGALASL